MKYLPRTVNNLNVYSIKIIYYNKQKKCINKSQLLGNLGNLKLVHII